MSLKPYYEFAKDQSNREQLMGVRLPDGTTALLVDYYCINADCDCQYVQIELSDVGPEGKNIHKLATFQLDVQNWGIDHVDILAQNSRAEDYVEDFALGLNENLKAMFQSRLQEAKEYGKRQAQPLSALDYQAGDCVGYAEIYPVDEPGKFQFNFMGRDFLVDDQYCIDPACKCNEVILTYVDLTGRRDGQASQFVVRVSLTTGKYSVELGNGYSNDEVRLIHRAYMKHIHDLGLFKQHYAKMKEFGNQHIRATNQRKRNTPIVKSAKVGRNDPCPCGSGKKYKRCCGAG